MNGISWHRACSHVLAMNIKNQKSCCLWLALFLTLFSSSLAEGYDEVAVTNGGTISGFVRIEGKIPKLPPLQITKFKEVCRNLPNESLIVGPSQGVRYAVVTLRLSLGRLRQTSLNFVICRGGRSLPQSSQ